jgi:hypothetical protein
MEPRPEHLSLHLCRISAGPAERLSLTDPYVEEVWSEFLGPTATMLARRLGRAIEQRPGGMIMDVRDLASSVGVAPSVALRALERLHRFEVVHTDLERGIVGVSGYAPPVGNERLFRLSETGRVAHDRFVAGLEVGHEGSGRASHLLAPAARVAVEPEVAIALAIG